METTYGIYYSNILKCTEMYYVMQRMFLPHAKNRVPKAELFGHYD